MGPACPCASLQRERSTWAKKLLHLWEKKLQNGGKEFKPAYLAALCTLAVTSELSPVPGVPFPAAQVGDTETQAGLAAKEQLREERQQHQPGQGHLPWGCPQGSPCAPLRVSSASATPVVPW